MNFFSGGGWEIQFLKSKKLKDTTLGGLYEPDPNVLDSKFHIFPIDNQNQIEQVVFIAVNDRQRIVSGDRLNFPDDYATVACDKLPTTPQPSFCTANGELIYTIPRPVAGAVDYLGQVVCVEIQYSNGTSVIYGTVDSGIAKQGCQSGPQD